MKTNDKDQAVARLALRGLLLLALLGISLSTGILTRAQSNTNAPSVSDHKLAVLPGNSAPVSATAIKPASASTNTPAPAEPNLPSKGGQEGIKVHGHWSIEVRNPDGSVDKHVEFENSLVTTNLSNMPGGAALLYELLNGSGAFAGSPTLLAGGWALNLQAPSGASPPCAFSIANENSTYGGLINSSLTPSCFVTDVPSFCVQHTTPPTSAPDCNQGLQATLNTLSSSTSIDAGAVSSFPTPSGFTLTGTILASQASGSIGVVEALAFINVPQKPGTSLAGFVFTSHSISTLTVAQGQSVSVTVTFSFS